MSIDIKTLKRFYTIIFKATSIHKKLTYVFYTAIEKYTKMVYNIERKKK